MNKSFIKDDDNEYCLAMDKSTYNLEEDSNMVRAYKPQLYEVFAIASHIALNMPLELSPDNSMKMIPHMLTNSWIFSDEEGDIELIAFAFENIGRQLCIHAMVSKDNLKTADVSVIRDKIQDYCAGKDYLMYRID